MEAKDTPIPPGYRLVPCDGAAHKPEVGGMIDNCTLCAPLWGWCRRLSPEGIRAIAMGDMRGGAATARELARVVDHLLSLVWDAPLRDVPGLVTTILGDYGPHVGAREVYRRGGGT